MHLLEPLNLPLLRLFMVAAWYIDSEQLCQGIIIHLRQEQSSKQTVCCSDSVLSWSRVNQRKNKLFSSALPSTLLYGPQTLFMVCRLFSSPQTCLQSTCWTLLCQRCLGLETIKNDWRDQEMLATRINKQERFSPMCNYCGLGEERVKVQCTCLNLTIYLSFDSFIGQQLVNPIGYSSNS